MSVVQLKKYIFYIESNSKFLKNLKKDFFPKMTLSYYDNCFMHF